jgi:serine O-acetyltransferase
MTFPSHTELERLMRCVRALVFPDYFPQKEASEQTLRDILASLGAQAVSEAFVKYLPELRRLLLTDVQAALHNDPAVHDAAEVILCYPFVTALLHHRVAHFLLRQGVTLLPRMISEMAHSETGIDIHPAATIGEYFCIDHGTGVVIGETAIIGNHVMLYQGVTLGARNFTYDENGHPIDLPRHPILEDHVTVYSNTSILGRVTIGHDTIVGGNVWLTHDVPPNSRIVQQKAVQSPCFSNGEGI